MTSQATLTWQVPYSAQLFSIPNNLYHEWIEKAAADTDCITFNKKEQSFLQTLGEGERDLTKTIASQFDRHDEKYFADVENRIMSVLLAWRMVKGEKERYTQCKKRKATWLVGNEGFNWRALITILVIIPRKSQIGIADFVNDMGNIDRKQEPNAHTNRKKRATRTTKPAYKEG